MATNYITKVTVSGTTYDLKDSEARTRIAALESYTDYLGVTTTVLTDGATTNPVKIGSKDVTAVVGNIVTYQSKEFIFNGEQWQEFGDLSGLGSLAYKNSASGSYTPGGSVSQPTFTGTEGNVSVTGTTGGNVSQPSFTGTKGNVSVTGTPEGSVATTTTVSSTNATVNSITAVGTLPSWSAAVSGETLSFSWSQGTLPTKGSNQTVIATISGATSESTFTGTSLTSTGEFTPSGTVSKPSFTGASITSTGKFTPAGSVSKPNWTGTAATITVE